MIKLNGPPTLGITTTAVCRPDILTRTYESFVKNIKDVNISKCNLYINIDPLPSKSNVQDTLDVARKFFKNVTYNTPEKASFARAVYWCWDNAKEDLILHLEDDWVLHYPIRFKDICEIMRNRLIFQTAIRAYRYKYNKMVLSPSFIRKGIYKKVLKNFTFERNPEKQLRDYQRFPFLLSQNGFRALSKTIMIEDIGRSWLDDINYIKPTRNFTKWSKMSDDFYIGADI